MQRSILGTIRKILKALPSVFVFLAIADAQAPSPSPPEPAEEQVYVCCLDDTLDPPGNVFWTFEECGENEQQVDAGDCHASHQLGCCGCAGNAAIDYRGCFDACLQYGDPIEDPESIPPEASPWFYVDVSCQVPDWMDDLVCCYIPGSLDTTPMTASDCMYWGGSIQHLGGWDTDNCPVIENPEPTPSPTETPSPTPEPTPSPTETPNPSPTPEPTPSPTGTP